MALGTLGGMEPLSIVRYYVGSRTTPPPVEFRQPTSPPCACKQNGQLLGEDDFGWIFCPLLIQLVGILAKTAGGSVPSGRILTSVGRSRGLVE